MEEEFLIPIVLFISIAFVLYYYFRFRYLERQALIEKGLTADDVKDLLKKTSKRSTIDGTAMAKWGIILIAIGLAILIGNQFSDEVMLALIFIFPGIGMLFYYYFIQKKIANPDV